MDKEYKKKMAQQTTIYGSIIDLFIGTIKIIFGFLYQSHALVVDGLHSFSDLFTDVFVILITRYTHEEPDEEHPYGHGRFETIGTVVLGTILVGVAGVIVYENLFKLFTQTSFAIPKWPAIIAAVLSVIMKEWAYQFQVKVGKKIGSNLIIANAWHSRSDALSSIAVLIGLIFSMLGLPWLDTVMAIVVAFMIAKIGWDFLWGSLKELVDTSLDATQVEAIKSKIMGIDGVRDMHNLRSRKIGEKALLDVNIEVSPKISVSEGHEIASYVAKNLIDHFEQVIDVTVHTDVEDDRVEGEDYSMQVKDLLPLRKEVISTINSKLSGQIEDQDILGIDLHYRGDHIIVEYCFSLAQKEKYNKERLKEINDACKDIPWLRSIQFYLKVD